MQKLMLLQQRKARRKELFRGIAAAAAVVVLLLLLSHTQYFVDAGEALVWNFLDHTSFQFEWTTDVSRVERYEMQYVPKGYVLEKDGYYEICGCIVYFNSDGERISFFYMPIDVELDIENENKELLTILKERGETVYYLRAETQEEESFMVWTSQDGTTKFCLSGKLPEEELRKILEGVKNIS